MVFNKHSKYEGQHAFLSASKYYWINYDPTKLVESYLKLTAAQKGTELHEFAAKCIKLGQKLPRNNKTLNMYVNDAIGFKMSPEVVLYYSDNCFGTADTISFRDNFLRIHDYKSGTSPTHMEQPLIYAALFCLEYRIKPSTIHTELRIYQNNDIEICEPVEGEIEAIMETICTFDPIITKIKIEEG